MPHVRHDEGLNTFVTPIKWIGQYPVMGADHDDSKSQAELDILTAADWWSREIMRSDRILNSVEQRLFDAVMHYRRLSRPDITDVPVIPKPPHLPTDLHYNEIPTQRYSDPPTIPSPAFGIKAVDIDIPDYNEEEDSWTGK